MKKAHMRWVEYLILSVVSYAGQSLGEIIMMWKLNGKAIIFDKFTPKHKQLSLPKKIVRPIISLLGTDIGRSFEEIMDQSGSNCQVEEDSPVMMQGMYRKIIVTKRMQDR